MNFNQYVTEFEHHLRVGEPKRSEIIAELNTHLDELSQNESPEAALGDPRTLAAKYNRIHIGFFSSPLRIAISLLAVFIFLESANEYNWFLMNRLFYSTADLQLYGVILFDAFVMLPSILLILIGRAAARTQRPARSLALAGAIVFSSFFLIILRADRLPPPTDPYNAVDHYPSVLAWIGNAALPAVIGTILLGGICILTAVVYAHKHPKRTSHFDALIATICCILGFLLTAVIVQTIDVGMNMRLPTLVTYAPALIVSTLLLIYFIMRSRRLQE